MGTDIPARLCSKKKLQGSKCSEPEIQGAQHITYMQKLTEISQLLIAKVRHQGTPVAAKTQPCPVNLNQTYGTSDGIGGFIVLVKMRLILSTVVTLCIVGT